MHDLDVQQLIDEKKVGSFHLVVIGLCALAVLMDGMDAQAIGYVGPTLTKAWNLKPGALGVVFSAGLVGMVLGSMGFSVVGDRIGRKPTILACVALLGGCTMLTATAGSVEALLAWRLAAGVGLGGVAPNIYALAAEYSPKRHRPMLMMATGTAFPLGAGLAGLIGSQVVGPFGWPSIFVITGGMTLLLLPILALFLPDSVLQFVLKGRSPTRIRRLVRRLAPQALLSDETRFVAFETKASGFPVAQLFQQERALLTVLIWLVYFATMFDSYFLSNWMPTLIHAAGLPISRAVLMSSLLQFGGVAGAIGVAFFISRGRLSRRLALVYALAATFVVGLGLSSLSPWLMGASVLGAGFFLNGGQIGAIILASGAYPTAIRSTGLGWASAIGRCGAAVGPLVGGLLVTLQWPLAAIFAVIAVPAFLAGVSVLAVGRASASANARAVAMAASLTPAE